MMNFQMDLSRWLLGVARTSATQLRCIFWRGIDFWLIYQRWGTLSIDSGRSKSERREWILMNIDIFENTEKIRSRRAVTRPSRVSPSSRCPSGWRFAPYTGTKRRVAGQVPLFERNGTQVNRNVVRYVCIVCRTKLMWSALSGADPPQRSMSWGVTKPC